MRETGLRRRAHGGRCWLGLPARKKREDSSGDPRSCPPNPSAAASAYAYPPLIKQPDTPLATAADQRSFHRDSHRQIYRDLAARIRRLANCCAMPGRPGDTVAVMDWDSHRYLE